MMLAKLLTGITINKITVPDSPHSVTADSIEIHNIQYDSRQINRGDIFVAIRGKEYNGHDFIEDAVKNGAAAIVVENDDTNEYSASIRNSITKITVPNTRIALAHISANFYNHPSKQLSLIGVTGTNGKTTTTHLIKSVLEENGTKTGLLSTTSYMIGDEIFPPTHTTPESLELNQLFTKAVRQGCSAVAMEVSSHALHQHRVDGLHFGVAVFTNLTRDHLDYHGSMEYYFKSKKMLFDQLNASSWAVVNIDDEWGSIISNSSAAHKLFYGLSQQAKVRAEDVSLSSRETQFTVVYHGNKLKIKTPLIGRFNVYNLLAAFAVGIALDVNPFVIKKGLEKTQAVAGRFEYIASRFGWDVVIDYAHTPDALEKTLQTIHDIFTARKQGRIISVFGCGGDRDNSKRPEMGRIASELSDIIIVTSDNPRRENPEVIIDSIITGCKTNSIVHKEIDRKAAILKALDFARPNDVVLIAGKGHEEYQIIGNKKYRFSDREIVEDYLRHNL